MKTLKLLSKFSYALILVSFFIPFLQTCNDVPNAVKPKNDKHDTSKTIYKQEKVIQENNLIKSDSDKNFYTKVPAPITNSNVIKETKKVPLTPLKKFYYRIISPDRTNYSAIGYIIYYTYADTFSMLLILVFIIAIISFFLLLKKRSRILSIISIILINLVIISGVLYMIFTQTKPKTSPYEFFLICSSVLFLLSVSSLILHVRHKLFVFNLWLIYTLCISTIILEGIIGFGVILSYVPMIVFVLTIMSIIIISKSKPNYSPLSILSFSVIILFLLLYFFSASTNVTRFAYGFWIMFALFVVVALINCMIFFIEKKVLKSE